MKLLLIPILLLCQNAYSQKSDVGDNFYCVQKIDSGFFKSPNPIFYGVPSLEDSFRVQIDDSLLIIADNEVNYDLGLSARINHRTFKVLRYNRQTGIAYVKSMKCKREHKYLNMKHYYCEYYLIEFKQTQLKVMIVENPKSEIIEIERVKSGLRLEDYPAYLWNILILKM